MLFLSNPSPWEKNISGSIFLRHRHTFVSRKQSIIADDSWRFVCGPLGAINPPHFYCGMRCSMLVLFQRSECVPFYFIVEQVVSKIMHVLLIDKSIRTGVQAVGLSPLKQLNYWPWLCQRMFPGCASQETAWQSLSKCSPGFICRISNSHSGALAVMLINPVSSLGTDMSLCYLHGAHSSFN